MPLASKHNLNLDAADPSDAEAIGNLFFAGFHDHPYFRKMMPDTSQARKCWTDHIIYCLQDPYTIVLKVTDSDVNKIVSMGLWLKPKKEEDRHQPGYEEGRVSLLTICIIIYYHLNLVGLAPSLNRSINRLSIQTILWPAVTKKLPPLYLEHSKRTGKIS